MSDAVKVAIWQGEGVPGDAMATAEAAGQAMACAVAAGTRLILFPEGYLTGYFVQGLKPGDLGAVEGALSCVAALARQHRINVLIGTHLQEGDVLRNSVVAFSETGHEVGRYHKRALFGAWEQATFAPGTVPLRLELAGLKVGVLICYDVEFPELVRAEAQAGVDLVAVSTALMAPYERVARMIVPVRAMENQLYVAYANRIGAEGGGQERLNFVGLSTIRGPEGEDCASAGQDAEMIVAAVSRSAITSVRRKESYLDDLEAVLSHAGAQGHSAAAR